MTSSESLVDVPLNNATAFFKVEEVPLLLARAVMAVNDWCDETPLPPYPAQGSTEAEPEFEPPQKCLPIKDLDPAVTGLLSIPVANSIESLYREAFKRQTLRARNPHSLMWLPHNGVPVGGCLVHVDDLKRWAADALGWRLLLNPATLTTKEKRDERLRAVATVLRKNNPGITIAKCIKHSDLLAVVNPENLRGGAVGDRTIRKAIESLWPAEERKKGPRRKTDQTRKMPSK